MEKETKRNAMAQVVFFSSSLSFVYTSREDEAENHIARKVYRQIMQAAGWRGLPIDDL